jgi:iron complex outermembrane receptor protein
MIGAGVVIVTLSGVPGPARAQSTPAASAGTEEALQEVVVMAQRRKQPLQDVPVVVAAVTAEELAQKNITSTSDLTALTPGLTNFVANGFVMPSLRGIGTQNNAAGNTGTVAVYLDGVYLASPQASLFGYNNIEQVEVDKGPQGTLFGRNATAGVIQVKTRDPGSTPGGRFAVGTDNYNTPTGDLYLTGPIAANLAADLAVHYSDQLKGYGRNLYTGNDVYKTEDLDVRTKWLWQPTDADRITAILDYEYLLDSSDGIQFHSVPYDYGITGGTDRLQSQLGSPWNYWASVDPTEKSMQGGASLEAQHTFGFATLTNIASYRRSDTYILSTSAVAPYNVLALQDHGYKQTSEELRLSSPDSSHIAWVTGFYFIDSHSTNAPYTFVGSGSDFNSSPCTAKFCPPYLPTGPLGLALGHTAAPTQFGAFPPNSSAFNTYVTSNVGSTSYAGYGQSTVPLDFLLRSLNLTVGLRYTAETESISGGDLIKAPGKFLSQPDVTFYKLTYKAGLDYHFTPDIMGYATASSGFQAGFYNANTLTAPASKPQTIDDYEAGIKSSFLDRKVVLNLGGFYYNYKNIVEPVVIAGVPNTTNGPKASLYGADLDLNVSVTPRLKVSASAEYLHSEWTSFPNAQTALPATAASPNGFCKVILCNPLGGVVSKTFDATGNRLPYAPQYVVNLSPSYRQPVGDGEVTLSVNWYYNSGYYNDASNIFRQAAYNTLGATGEWRPQNGSYSVKVWGKNLTDKAVFARMSTTAPFGEFFALSPPRTYGISVDYQF